MEGGSFLIQILHLGNYVIGIFSFIFLFYTNSFLIKQGRKNLVYSTSLEWRKTYRPHDFLEQILLLLSASAWGY